MRRRALGWVLFVGWLGLGLAGCEGCKEQAVPKTCTKMFARCQLPKGPIGVCQLTRCRQGQKKPCLACVSQH